MVSMVLSLIMAAVATTGVVRGVVVEDATDRPPAAIQIEYGSCGGWSEQPNGYGAVSVAPDPSTGAFSLRLPSGCLDLAVRDERRAPVLLWNVAVHGSGGETDLGELRLREGGTVAALLIDTEGSGVPGAWVEAVPESVLALPWWRPAERLEQTVEVARSERSGWVSLVGVPAGWYRLRIRAEGFPVLLSDPLVVERGRCTQLDSIPLRFGGALVVEGLAAVPLRRLRVALVATDVEVPLYGGRYLESVAVGDRNRVRFDRLPAGEYDLRITGAGGRYAGGSSVSVPAVHVKPGKTVRVRVDVDPLEVHGRLTLHGEGVAADVWLGAPGRGVVVTRTGQDGRFTARVLGPGEHRVVAWDEDAGVRFRWLSEMTRSGHALRLELPGGEISGRVFDVNGRRADEVVVEATPASGSGLLPVACRTRRDGSYRLRGLASGSWQLGVRGSHSRVIEPLTVRIGTDERVDGIVLELDANPKASLRTIEERGEPVAGVSVAFLRCANRRYTTVTDPEGWASCPSAVQGSAIVVGGRSRPATLLSSERGERAVRIAAAGTGASLEITIPGAKYVSRLKRSLRLDGADGAVLVSDLAGVLPGVEAALRDPRAQLRLGPLAPGRYELVWVHGELGPVGTAAEVELVPAVDAAVVVAPPPRELIRRLENELH